MHESNIIMYSIWFNQIKYLSLLEVKLMNSIFNKFFNFNILICNFINFFSSSSIS